MSVSCSTADAACAAAVMLVLSMPGQPLHAIAAPAANAAYTPVVHDV
jgi:hypothetical protein